MRYLTHFFTCFLLLLFSCREEQRGGDRDTLAIRINSISDSLLKSNNVSLCDTCISTLIVEHMECTECKDIYVDSGTVYLSRKIISEFISSNDDGQNSKPQKKKGIQLLPRINTTDLYLTRETDFNELWPAFGDFHKLYRIRGRVAEINGSTLKFDLMSYTLIDSIYARRFIVE